LRFYFGNSDKTLIRRQREDDPNHWDSSVFPGQQTPIATTSPAPPPLEED
jgi:hypothetical protein